MRYRCILFCMVLAAAAGVGCGEQVDTILDTQTLVERLGAARSGEVITVGDGRFDGPLTIPAGVTLRARTAGATTVAWDQPGAAIRATAGAEHPTRIDGLRIDTSGHVGLLIRGAGSFEGTRLTIDAAAGIGVAADQVTKLSLQQVQITGNITKDKIPALAFPLEATAAPILGLALARIADVALNDIEVRGFAGFGVVLVDCEGGQWSGGAVQRNVGVGILKHGGSLELQGVQVRETMAGQTGLAVQPYGMVIRAKAALKTQRLAVADNDGIGIFQDDASSAHEDLQVVGNRSVGLWLQSAVGSDSAPALRLGGTANQIANNHGGGIFALHAGPVVVENAEIVETAYQSIVATKPADLGETRMADGIQIVQPPANITLGNLLLRDNERVGLLISAGAASGSMVDLRNVEITGTGKFPEAFIGGIEQLPAWEISAAAFVPTPDAGNRTSLLIAAVKAVFPGVGPVAEQGLIGSGGLISEQGIIAAGGKIGPRGLDPDGGE